MSFDWIEAQVRVDYDAESPKVEWWIGVDKEGWDRESKLDIILEASYYPPGTVLRIELPSCPDCGEVRLPGELMTETCGGYKDGVSNLSGICGYLFVLAIEPE